MQLAQLNIGTFRYPVDDPRMHGFTSRLDAVNALAERSEGFVWRLVDDDPTYDAAINLRLPGMDDDNIAVNMSVWTGIDPLFRFVYKTAHTKVMDKRTEYFEPPAEAFMVLWWVEDGHIPTLEEAATKLNLIRANGPGPHAFDFATPFDENGLALLTNFPRKDCA